MVSYNAVPFPDNINLVFSFFFINSLLHTLINLINIKCEIPGNICKPKPQTVQPGVLPKYPPTELSEQQQYNIATSSFNPHLSIVMTLPTCVSQSLLSMLQILTPMLPVLTSVEAEGA